MSNRAFDLLDAKGELADARQALATYSKALSQPGLDADSLSFLTRAVEATKRRIDAAKRQVSIA